MVSPNPKASTDRGKGEHRAATVTRVDQAASIGALPLTVAKDTGCPVACLPGADNAADRRAGDDRPMARRRPRALRAEQSVSHVWGPTPPLRIHGLSTRASLAVHRVEYLSGSFYIHPGATDCALRRYREFLHPPGRRPLYPRESYCSCTWCSFDDVRHARDVLEEVLERLPERARAELSRLVKSLDAVFLHRTLPDPFAHRRQWRTQLWWYRRLADSSEWG
ncbi:hypothetical protein OG264_37430 [Streptomyces xanthophaeus]|uniref:hypothetical protein n=1 Tax=Streptomyces xanthophaeus TaxID=67385 RepID=UPI003866435C|nr:hypothetical protein OG264_37430 [Streptomyces xanthophaeus]WST58321.1 hypothetical protein OG605_01005 [Streptomyces xanthophaeus]